MYALEVWFYLIPDSEFTLLYITPSQVCFLILIDSLIHFSFIHISLRDTTLWGKVCLNRLTSVQVFDWVSQCPLVFGMLQISSLNAHCDPPTQDLCLKHLIGNLRKTAHSNSHFGCRLFIKCWSHMLLSLLEMSVVCVCSQMEVVLFGTYFCSTIWRFF